MRLLEVFEQLNPNCLLLTVIRVPIIYFQNMRLLEVFEQLNPNCLLLTVHTGSAILAKDTKAELTGS